MDLGIIHIANNRRFLMAWEGEEATSHGRAPLFVLSRAKV